MISKIVFTPKQFEELVENPDLARKVLSNLRSMESCTVAMALAFAKHQYSLELEIPKQPAIAEQSPPEESSENTQSETEGRPKTRGGKPASIK